MIPHMNTSLIDIGCPHKRARILFQNNNLISLSGTKQGGIKTIQPGANNNLIFGHIFYTPVVFTTAIRVNDIYNVSLINRVYFLLDGTFRNISPNTIIRIAEKDEHSSKYPRISIHFKDLYRTWKKG